MGGLNSRNLVGEPMKKNKRTFNALKEQLINRMIKDKQKQRIPLWFILKKCKTGLLNFHQIEKMKLISEQAYREGRRELFLQNLYKKNS